MSNENNEGTLASGILRNCGNCAWFDRVFTNDEQQGTCHLNPPAVDNSVGQENQSCARPRVSPLNYCSHFDESPDFRASIFVTTRKIASAWAQRFMEQGIRDEKVDRGALERLLKELVEDVSPLQ